MAWREVIQPAERLGLYIFFWRFFHIILHIEYDCFKNRFETKSISVSKTRSSSSWFFSDDLCLYSNHLQKRSCFLFWEIISKYGFYLEKSLQLSLSDARTGEDPGRLPSLPLPSPPCWSPGMGKCSPADRQQVQRRWMQDRCWARTVL